MYVIKSHGLYDDFVRKGGNTLKATTFCPGCGHGIVIKIIGDVITKLGIQDSCIMLSAVGCCVFNYYYFDTGNIQVPHGRAPACASAISRLEPDAVVVCYQGDGDLASIGLNETIQAANRGENIAVIFINNTVYGMTSGQMAPTTLINQKTITTPNGRQPEHGYPIHVCEILDTLEAPRYIERVSLSDIPHIVSARQAVTKALQMQRDKLGYAFVEILSPCPTILKMNAEQSLYWLRNYMEKEFPVKKFRENVDYSRIQKPVTGYQCLESVFETMEGEPGQSIASVYGNKKIKIAGFGGQGVLSMGIMIVQAAAHDGYHVSYLPEYGPEQRGGTSNCSVIISTEPIASPIVDSPDILVAFNEPSLEKFAKTVKQHGLTLYDSESLSQVIDKYELPVNVENVPATALATARGFKQAANVVMLGRLARSLKISDQAWKSVLRKGQEELFELER